MIEKISCPNCKHILEVKGKPLEKIIIVCPKCNTKGVFQFEDKNYKNRYYDFQSYIKLIFALFLISILILFSIISFQTTDIFFLVISIILIPLFFLLKVDWRIPLVFALLLFVLSAIGLAFYKDTLFANQLTNNGYWLIVVGVLCYIVNSLRKYVKITKLSSLF